MPDYTNAAIIGGGQAIGQAINAYSTGQQNKKSRQFTEKMYGIQKADNLAFWNMQNEYNSPQSQMKRFQEAGLNPHLIYGQGNSGNAQQISTPDVQPAQFRTPEWGNAVSAGALGYINSIYDLEIKQAQNDLLKSQVTTQTAEAALKAGQLLNLQTDTARKEFDLAFENEMRQTSADARRELVRQMRTNTDISLRRDIREQVMQSSNLKEASERISNLIQTRAMQEYQMAHTAADKARIIAETARIRKSISLMSQEGVLKELDVKLSKDNIRPGDPIWYRWMAQGFSALYDSLFK